MVLGGVVGCVDSAELIGISVWVGRSDEVEFVGMWGRDWR